MKKKILFATMATASVLVVGASVSPLAVYADETESTGCWQEEDGVMYWYEGGVKQGTEGRGKEIYDPDSDAWYWLDAVQDGAKAVSKDVYQESYAGRYADNDDETGKWCRYDENGKMVKGWDYTDAGTYYFDETTGAMAKGYATVDGKEYYFNTTTGILESGGYEVPETGWITIDGSDYWYEGYYRQGYSLRESYRGKEIYDPESDAWYWLDNVDCGKKAVSKDVYQESDAGDWAESDDGTGKWVRYDENGHMVKGWQTNDAGTYYFDYTYGTMAKGTVTIDGVTYIFDTGSGILQGGYGSISNVCNLPTSSSYYKYEYAYRNQDTSGLSESEMSFYYGLKEYLDCAFRFSTPYEQEKAVHDYMTYNCSYDTLTYEATLGHVDASYYRAEAFAPTGVFVDRSAVCDGFSKAFKLCMDILGIECTRIIGTSNGEAHGWNAVKLDGEWYLVDVTFDSPYDYLYFNLPASFFNQNHTPYSAYDDIEATSVKYSGDYVLETTTATANADIDALLEAHYMEDNSSTIYRIYITKEDGTDWTDDDTAKYWYESIYYDVVDLIYLPLSGGGATACYTFVGNDVTLEELYITTDERIIDVEAYIKNFNDTMEENAEIILYLDKADGTDWENVSEAREKANKLCGIYSVNAQVGYVDGKRAALIVPRTKYRMWEYIVEDATGEDDIDVDALNQFLEECAADDNLDVSDVVIIRLNAREDAVWSDFLDDILTVPDEFYGSNFVIYEDRSAAKLFRSWGVIYGLW